MLSVILYGALALLVAAVIVAVLVVVLPDDTVARAPRDVVPAGLPAGDRLGADDVHRLRLPVALRGYRMVDTDAVLDRLSAELERRDTEIAALREGSERLIDGHHGSPEALEGHDPLEPAAPEQAAAVVARPIALGETPEDAEAAVRPVRHRAPDDDAAATQTVAPGAR